MIGTPLDATCIYAEERETEHLSAEHPRAVDACLRVRTYHIDVDFQCTYFVWVDVTTAIDAELTNDHAGPYVLSEDGEPLRNTWILLQGALSHADAVRNTLAIIDEVWQSAEALALAATRVVEQESADMDDDAFRAAWRELCARIDGAIETRAHLSWINAPTRLVS